MALSKSDIIDHVAKTQNLTKAVATEVTNTFFGLIQNSLENGDDVNIVGFGNFKVTQKNARTSRNPRTGEPIEIAAKKVPTFKPGKALKEAVNK